MSNPKDWFRRRRREGIDEGVARGAGDPFADDSVIALGSRGSGAEVRALGRDPLGPDAVNAGPPRRATVPPPPPRSAELRPARLVEPHVFAVRPQLARRSEPADGGEAVPREPHFGRAAAAEGAAGAM